MSFSRFESAGNWLTLLFPGLDRLSLLQYGADDRVIYNDIVYRIAFCTDTKMHEQQRAQNWNKSFTHIQHRAGAVGRESLVN